MLVFSSIVPHPPILVPSVGRDNLKKIKKTVTAMKQLEEILYAAKPDVLLVISPHSPVVKDAFAINLNLNYQGGLEEFGDFSTKLNFKGDLELIDKIKEGLEEKVPLVLINEEKIDHGLTVPLYYLTRHLPKFSLIPMSFSLLDYQTHLDFGDALREELYNTNKRVAIIASGDLSHRLSKEAPGGYSPSGKEFDKTLIKLLKKKDTAGILKLKPQLIEEAGECGLRSIIILLGILNNINYQPELLSYEGPFGVGYMVMNFRL